MPRIVRNQTINDLEDAVLLLRNDGADRRAAEGCCGCGAWMCDVQTRPNPPDYPRGEGYCWACVRRLDIGDYEQLPGR